MVGAFNPHAASLGLASKTIWLWIFLLSIKYFWLEMVDYQEIQRRLQGLFTDLRDFTVHPRAEEAGLRMLLGPRELLNPGEDLNGIKKFKRPVCEERVPMGPLLRGKPGNTLLRKHPLDWQL